MKKRGLSLLLALCMVLGMVTALPEIASAKTYGDLTYEVSNGKVTITDCANTATQVDIPEKIDGCPVTMIGGGAFRYCSNLKYVTIPETVTYISYLAFSECNGLESIVIPNSVTMIDDDAFWKCAGLINVTIPDSVNDIGSYAFD